MIVGTVLTDYAAFVFNDDPEILEAVAEQINDSVYMEVKFRMMGYEFDTGDDQW